MSDTYDIVPAPTKEELVLILRSLAIAALASSLLLVVVLVAVASSSLLCESRGVGDVTADTLSKYSSSPCNSENIGGRHGQKAGIAIKNRRSTFAPPAGF